MSAPAYAQPRYKKRQFIDWQTFYPKLAKRIRQVAEAYNEQFPLGKKSEGKFSRAHRDRMKESEIKTAMNIYLDYIKKVVYAKNAGRHSIDNVAETNNSKAMQGNKSKSLTPIHLSKLTRAGLLLGHRAGSDAPKYYQDKPEGGQGFGWEPVKKFRGWSHNYYLLVNPEIIRDLLPKGMELWEMTGFLPDGSALTLPQNQHLPHLDFLRQNPENEASITQNLGPFKYGQNPLNEEMRKEACASAQLGREDGSRGRRNTEEAKNASPETQNGDEKGHADFSAAPDMAVAAGIDENGEAGSIDVFDDAPALGDIDRFSKKARYIADLTRGMKQSELAVKQSVNEAFFVAMYAMMLIKSYVKQIADREGKIYLSSEIERGRMAAIELILSHPPEEREAAVDDYVATIDRMAGLLDYDPVKFFAVSPSYWLHPDYRTGIRKVFHDYVIPWRETGESFYNADKARKLAKEKSDEAEQKASMVDPYANLAFHMKRDLMRIHPTNSRIKDADAVGKWREDIFDLIHKDLGAPRDRDGRKVIAYRVRDVWKWVSTSKDKSAIFWREQAGRKGQRGIQSAGAFRRHYLKIQINYFEAQERSRRQHSQATTLPPSDQKPTQIPKNEENRNKVLPSSENYNPRR